MKKWVEGYEGFYEIADDGTLYRHYLNGAIKKCGTQNSDGYCSANLSKHGKGTYKLIHRIVATTFIVNPEDYEFVDHIDEDKTNNHVDNLRWCTRQMNTEYYTTKDGRDYHASLRRKHKKSMLLLLAKVTKERKLMRVAITKERVQLEEEKAKFLLHVNREEARLTTISSTYNGYKNTSGVKFASVDDMIAVTGKPITVDGKEFVSAGSAAQYIVDGTEGKNKATISKELRRYLQGKRSAWVMYDKFTIGY